MKIVYAIKGSSVHQEYKEMNLLPKHCLNAISFHITQKKYFKIYWKGTRKKTG